VFALAERQLPSIPCMRRSSKNRSPDVVLISPLVHFGSAQADFVAVPGRVAFPSACSSIAGTT
jgi:hypothetical protein